MTKEDTAKIFVLMQQFYPNARQLKDSTTRLAWELAIQRFPYEAVKNSVVEYAIGNKFFPDLSDITSGLIPEVAPLHEPASEACDVSWAIPHMQKMVERLGADAVPEGVSTWADVKDSMSWHDWAAIMRNRRQLCISSE